MNPAVPYWRLALFYFAYYAALGAFSPYFAPFLQDRGLSPWQIGVVMSFWYGTRMLAPSLWGAASGRARRPILWLRAGATATLASFALFLLPLRFGWILAVMCVFASFYNAILPQFEAITLAHLGAHRSAYGRIRVWGSVGFVLANLGFGVLLGAVGYHWLIALLLPPFGLLVFSALVNRDPVADPAQVTTAGGFRASVLPRLRDPRLWVFLIAALLMQVAHGPFYVFYSVYLDHHHYPAQAIGGLWAVGVAAEIGMFLVVPALLARVSARRLIAICFAIGAVRWLATAWLADVPLALVLAQTGHAFTFAAFHGASMQIISQFFPGSSGVHGQGLMYGLSSGVGGVLGALIAAALWEIDGGTASFLGSAVISLVGAALVLRWPLEPGRV